MEIENFGKSTRKTRVGGQEMVDVIFVTGKNDDELLVISFLGAGIHNLVESLPGKPTAASCGSQTVRFIDEEYLPETFVKCIAHLRASMANVLSNDIRGRNLHNFVAAQNSRIIEDLAHLSS